MAFCDQCGGALEDKAHFCPGCGAAVRAEAMPVLATPAVQPLSSPGSGLTCPGCGRSDCTAMASDIHLDQKAPKPAEPNDDYDADGVLMMLEPPEKPEVGGLAGWFVCPWIPVAGPILMLMAPLAKSARIVVGLWLLTALATVLWYEFSGKARFDDPLAGAFVYLYACGVVVFYYIALIVRWPRHRRNIEQKQLPAWERATANWKRLAYCARCDAVFLLGGGETAPIEDVEKFLARH